MGPVDSKEEWYCFYCFGDLVLAVSGAPGDMPGRNSFMPAVRESGCNRGCTAPVVLQSVVTPVTPGRGFSCGLCSDAPALYMVSPGPRGVLFGQPPVVG